MCIVDTVLGSFLQEERQTRDGQDTARGFRNSFRPVAEKFYILSRFG